MSLDELLAFSVGKVAARSAVLFLRPTSPMLGKAIQLLNAWGRCRTSAGSPEAIGLLGTSSHT